LQTVLLVTDAEYDPPSHLVEALGVFNPRVDPASTPRPCDCDCASPIRSRELHPCCRSAPALFPVSCANSIHCHQR
jgi:hypothetical protein